MATTNETVLLGATLRLPAPCQKVFGMAGNYRLADRFASFMPVPARSPMSGAFGSEQMPSRLRGHLFLPYRLLPEHSPGNAETEAVGGQSMIVPRAAGK